MKSPTDTTRRPTRRFSAIQPVRRKPVTAKPAVADEEAVAPDMTLVAMPDPVKPAKRPAPAPAVPAEVPALKFDKAEGEARLAKVMARAGLCSRRDAEAWIAAGRVAVNGVVIESPALNVGPTDQVTVDGYPIEKPEHTRLFMFHKTRGLVTTARDPEGRSTIYDALPEDLPRLITVGRLDINTEGLLLLTNDGGLARLLELPATGWLRRYRVRANGQIDQGRLDALAKGITVDGVDYAGIDAKLDRVQGANAWLTLGLREGKNREVKRVLEHLGLAVTRLIRISFGPFQLGDLTENGVEEVKTRILRDQLGSALAKQAGLVFASDEAAAPPAAAPQAEPRRKTSRSATADRKGRAVPVERIASVGAKTEGRPAGRDRPRDGARGTPRDAGAGRGFARQGGTDRIERPGEEGERRPARTLRQADAVYRRPDDEGRRPPQRAGARFQKDGADRPARDGFRGQRPGVARPAGEGRRENADRPRTGRVDDRRSTPRFTKEAGERPARGAFRGARPEGTRAEGEARRDGASRPRTGRADDSRREGRNEGLRPQAQRSGQGAGGARDGAGPRAPRPSFRGKDDRPGGGKPPRTGGGGGGRGKPRG